MQINFITDIYTKTIADALNSKYYIHIYGKGIEIKKRFMEIYSNLSTTDLNMSLVPVHSPFVKPRRYTLYMNT